ncbi:MAG: DUF3791 domain-containing protein [Marinifilaceae bacterium]|nr:DUF3791 domain-containing protein [Marinifilaceae bacterium]
MPNDLTSRFSCQGDGYFGNRWGRPLRRSLFLSCCIGQYKNEKGLTGEEAMKELNRYGVLDYLSDHFEILHTQSRQWLLADIDEFINTRKTQRQ